MKNVNARGGVSSPPPTNRSRRKPACRTNNQLTSSLAEVPSKMTASVKHRPERWDDGGSADRAPSWEEMG